MYRIFISKHISESNFEKANFRDSNPLWKKLKCEHDGTNCIPTLKTALQSTEL